jgi:purine-nucleoside phosphorylase
LLEAIVTAGQACGMVLAPGVYAAVTGPSYETPAEIRALRTAGADAVGMSTSREVLAGVAAGLECAAVSLITNRASGLSATPLNHAEVLAMGRLAGQQLGELLDRVLATRWE